MTKIASWLLTKLIAKKANINPLYLIGGAFLIIILIPVAIFSPSSSDATDAYLDAYNEIGCGNDNVYILEDIRAFESYVDPTSYGNISKEAAKERLSNIYLDVIQGTSPNTKRCLLKNDEKIKQNLSTRYTISATQMDEMLLDVSAVRNGRQYLVMPFEGIQTGKYDPDSDRDGIVIKGNDHESVKASHDGIIKDIYTSNDQLKYRDPSCENSCSNKMTKGLSVVLEYQMQTGLNEDGEYDQTTMFITYAFLQDVPWNVGDSIKQDEIIGRTKKNSVYIELHNIHDDVLDPNQYLCMEIQNVSALGLPFDLPISITSEVGSRELAGATYHYGLDMDKGQDSAIKAIADGEVFATNTTCSPYGGRLGSRCPEMNMVSGGGNYVQIKFEYEDTTYYATYMHMAQVDVHVGDNVFAGDIIGTQGHSGNSSASHLHLEIHKDSPAVSIMDGLVDPKELLDFEEN